MDYYKPEDIERQLEESRASVEDIIMDVFKYLRLNILDPYPRIKLIESYYEIFKPYLTTMHLKRLFLKQILLILSLEWSYCNEKQTFTKKLLTELIRPHELNSALINSLFIFGCGNKYIIYLLDDPRFAPNEHLVQNGIIAINNELYNMTKNNSSFQEFSDLANLLLRPYFDFHNLENHQYESIKSLTMEGQRQNPLTQTILDILLLPPDQKPLAIQTLIDNYELQLLEKELTEIQEKINFLYEVEVEDDGLRPLPLMALESFLKEDARVRHYHAQK